MIPEITEIIAGLISGQYTAEQANAWIHTHMEMAVEWVPKGPVTHDMQCLSDVFLLGEEGEPLVISSELETTQNSFGDTLMRFEVRNPEGRSRYGVNVEVTRLRVDA